MQLENFNRKDTFVDEMSEHERILDELTRRLREISTRTNAFISEQLSGPNAEEWSKIFEVLTKIDRPNKFLLDSLIKLIPKLANSYPLIVDYGRTIEDGARAGRYDMVSSNINSINFSKSTRAGVHEVVLKLYHFDWDGVSHKTVLADLDRDGFRPADIYELLVFGERYPDIQRDFPIPALGSMWNERTRDRFFVPVLCLGASAERRLMIEAFDDPWSRQSRFAAVRK